MGNGYIVYCWVLEKDNRCPQPEAVLGTRATTKNIRWMASGTMLNVQGASILCAPWAMPSALHACLAQVEFGPLIAESCGIVHNQGEWCVIEVDHMYTPCMQISSASKPTWVAGTKHLIGHWGTDKYNSCALIVTTRKDSSFKHSWNGTSGKNTMGQSGGIS